MVGSFSSSSLCLAILIMMGSITNFILSFECRQRFIFCICNWWLFRWISIKHFWSLSYLCNVKTSLRIKYWVIFGKTTRSIRLPSHAWWDLREIIFELKRFYICKFLWIVFVCVLICVCMMLRKYVRGEMCCMMLCKKNIFESFVCLCLNA